MNYDKVTIELPWAQKLKTVQFSTYAYLRSRLRQLSISIKQIIFHL